MPYFLLELRGCLVVASVAAAAAATADNGDITEHIF